MNCVALALNAGMMFPLKGGETDLFEAKSTNSFKQSPEKRRLEKLEGYLYKIILLNHPILSLSNVKIIFRSALGFGFYFFFMRLYFFLVISLLE
tara:strand:- start:111 stop:392 length:282 start_codon:yes stop_codon:yes gene_type:complete